MHSMRSGQEGTGHENRGKEATAIGRPSQEKKRMVRGVALPLKSKGQLVTWHSLL